MRIAITDEHIKFTDERIRRFRVNYGSDGLITTDQLQENLNSPIYPQFHRTDDIKVLAHFALDSDNMIVKILEPVIELRPVRNSLELLFMAIFNNGKLPTQFSS